MVSARRQRSRLAHLFEMDGEILEVAESGIIPGVSGGGGQAVRPAPFRIAMATRLLDGGGYVLGWLTETGVVSRAGHAKRRREAVRWLRRVAPEQVR